ncbi:MAG: YkgJ family cysteine cluster protein [Desulfotalea sp.]
MQEKILRSIYNSFQTWADDREVACKKGCSTCCTQNVTVTAPEAELIHKYALDNGIQEYLAKILATPRTPIKTAMTTNDFAKACLNGENDSPQPSANFTPCLFLQDNICGIYEVRPFACRAFCSTIACDKDQIATISEPHTASLTAVYQIIEHVGQRKFWGNFYDVLIAMTENPTYKEAGILLNKEMVSSAQKRLLTAKPLAGFILNEDDMKEAEPLLNTIFSANINGKSIESILNGN